MLKLLPHHYHKPDPTHPTLRHSAPPLPADSQPLPALAQASLPHTGPIPLDALRWVLAIRYKIALLLLAILLVAYSLDLVSSSTATKLAITDIYYLLAGVLYTYILNRITSSPTTNNQQLTTNNRSLIAHRSSLISIIRNLQVPELLLLATTATYYFGGVLSPFFVLFPLSILPAILLLHPKGVYRVGLLAVLLYCSLALFELWGKGQSSFLPFPTQLSSSALFAWGHSSTTYALYVAIVSSVLLLTAYIGNRVAILIRSTNQQIEAQLHDSNTLYDLVTQLANMIDEQEMLSYLARTSKRALDAELVQTDPPFTSQTSKLVASRLTSHASLTTDNRQPTTGHWSLVTGHPSLCLIGLFNKDGDLVIKATAGDPPDLTPYHSSLIARRSSLGDLFALLQRGELVAIEDIRQYPELREFAPGAKPPASKFGPTTLNLESPEHNSQHATRNSLYFFPIKAESTVIGAIVLSFRSPAQNRRKSLALTRLTQSKIGNRKSETPLSQGLCSLMSTITTQAALAIQRAQLISDARRLGTEMSQLYTLGLYTGSTLSKDEVLRRTSDNIESLLNPDAYYIALYDEASDILSFEVFIEHGRQIGKLKMSLDNGGITSRIIQRGQPILVQDWSQDEVQITDHELQIRDKSINLINPKSGRPLGHQNPKSDMLSYLGVPMFWEERVIGVISVQCEESMAFDPHDEHLLAALAAQTGMALENAKLHQLAQDQAKLDSLTRVYNHGYFVQLVRNAVAASDQDDTQVSLIMLDIDHFKHYNDSFGHVAGDNVLRMVAQALKNCVRETDAVGRWGGEEFGILLLGVGITEAKKIARQVRRAISELSPANGYGQVLPNPTISQGISSYPYPSATSNDLIEEADTALYHAKKHGRNQLVVYEAAGGMKDDTTTTGHLTRSRASKELNSSNDNVRSARRSKRVDEDVAATTNDLSHHGEGTNPQLAAVRIEA